MNASRFAIAVTGGLLGLLFLGMWLLIRPVDIARAASFTVCTEGPPLCDYAVIQDAVDVANDSDVIKIATGIYTHTHARPAPSGYPGPTVITQAVYISKAITIRGGYTAPGFAEPPDPEANPTILDAQGRGRVLLISGDISATVEGLALTGGDASDLGGGQAGADTGGGIYANATGVTITRNCIFQNVGAFRGAGVYLTDGPIWLSHNQIISNTSTWRGGGLGMDDANAIIESNSIIGNITTGTGGGGGVSAEMSDFILVGNLIIANSTIWDGGGLLLNYSQVELINNVIADNQIGHRGSGIHMCHAVAHMWHNTIARNTGGNGVGIYVTDDTIGHGSTAVLTNTILVGHDVGIVTTVLRQPNSARLEGTLWGSGVWANGQDWAGPNIVTGTVNVWGDPGFVDPDNGDYHIDFGSEAIDAGVNANVTKDIDNEPRPTGAGYDIGADELFQGPRLAVIKWAVPDPVQAGSQLTYSLRITNSGTVSLTATITDLLPIHVTPTGVLTWTPPHILPGDTWTETVVVTAEMGYVGPLTNVVRVTTEQGAMGVCTNTVAVEEPVSGLSAVNDSPTPYGNPTTLTATITAGSHVAYTWALGDGTTGIGKVVTHTYPNVGPYTATVTASNPLSQLTATTTVTITEVPIEDLTATNDSPTHLGDPTTLTATVTSGSNVAYAWTFGDGEIGAGSVVSHTYPTIAVYTAVVTASNSVSELTATTVVTVFEPRTYVYLPVVIRHR